MNPVSRAKGQRSALHSRSVRYEADARPPAKLAVALGLQLAVLAVSLAVLVAAIVFRAGGAEEHLPWGVFATVLACGISTALQATGGTRVGAGYVLVHVPAGTFVAVSVTALVEGGPALLATLVLVTGVAQAVISQRLSWLHRVLTPVVTGTIVMLLPVTVMPILFPMLHSASGEIHAAAAPASGGVTILTIILVVLRGTGTVRLWAPALGVVAGSATAAFFGAYDTALVSQAAWIGLPPGRPPGLDLEFGPEFWAVLPAFLFITLVAATKSIGVVAAAHRVSWRRRPSVDFRAVQGGIAGEGAGNALGALLGAPPHTPYPSGVAMAEITGVAARSVGLATGVVLTVLAFLPKAVAAIAAVPPAVAATSVIFVMAMLFTIGVREAGRSATGMRDGLIMGVSFWTGTAFQFDMVYPEFFSQFAGGVLSNGMTAGGLTAIALTLLVHLGSPRSRRFKGRLDTAELPRIQEFLRAFASAAGLEPVCERMEAAAEETLLTLIQSKGIGAEGAGAAGGENVDVDAAGEGDPATPALLLTARREEGAAVLKFVVGADGGTGGRNLQDRIAFLGETAEEPASEHEEEMSLRLLRHLASSVRHQQFHGMDVVTLRVLP